MAFVDIDHFKQVNDTCGHATGDQVLRHLAGLVRGFLRTRDDVFRFGGEEFVIVMSDEKRFSGPDACEPLRRRIESHDWPALAPGLKLTASFGVARWPGELAAAALLARAGAALYEGKRSGPNRVIQA